jgi:hypothetical protein
MKRLLLLAVLAGLLGGCGLANTKFMRRNDRVGDEVAASVGDALVFYEYGLHNDVYDRDIEKFRGELVYSGRSGNTVRFSYREFSNDLARPAFTQDLSYDLDAGDTVSFRGLTLRITEATNDHVIATVVRSLNNKANQ